MFAHYDENELLAYIEDELDADAARSLRERLASDPEVELMVEAMRRDRAALRAEPEVEVPDDLAERIEQALTRPMLIAAWGEDEIEDAAPSSQVVTQPGEYRRRHNQPARRRKLYRFAMAASLGLVVFGASWIGINAGLRTYNDWQSEQLLIAQAGPRDTERFQSEGSEVASDQTTLSELTSAPTPSSAIAELPARGARAAPSAKPGRLNDELVGLAEGRIAARARHVQVPEVSDPIAVDFALVIQSDDFTIAEKGIEQVMTSQSQPMALVQNFSFEEAMKLERQWLATPRQQSRDTQPRFAGVERQRARQHRLHEMTDRALMQMHAVEGDFEPSRQLAGPRDLAASYARQLDYAGRGATHTITIRLSQLPQLLEELDRAQLPGVKQFILEPLSSEDAPASAMNWAQSLTAVQSALAALELLEGDPLIDLPLVIE